MADKSPLSDKDNKLIKGAVEAQIQSYERHINGKNVNELIKETYRAMKKELEGVLSKL